MSQLCPRTFEASDKERQDVTQNKRKQKIVICVAGMTGCGKSTLAKRLAKKYGLKYLSGGSMLKTLAKKMGYKPDKRGWWESEEGMKFLQQRTKNPEFDKKVDKELMKWAKRGNVVFDSWTMSWLLKKSAFKVWLEVTPEERARRLARRDHISVEEALKVLKEKDAKTKSIYKDLYGFNLGEDLSPFNLILNTTELESDEVFQTLCMVIDRVVLGKA